MASRLGSAISAVSDGAGGHPDRTRDRIAGLGPEGPLVYVGFIIFPYAALLYLAGAVTQNVGLLYVSLLLVLIQFPVYGIILSLFENARLAAKVVFLLHAGLALFILGIILFVWTFRCLMSGC